MAQPILWGQAGAVEAAGGSDAFALLLRVEGDVRIVRAEGEELFRSIRGERLYAGDHVVTGSDGRALVVFPGNETSLNLAPDTRIVLETLLFTAPTKEDAGLNQTDLTLEYGDIVGRVRSLDKDNPNHRFHVRTAVGVAGIRGTTFRIRYVPPVADEPPLLEISTLEGLVVILPLEETLAALAPSAGTEAAAGSRQDRGEGTGRPTREWPSGQAVPAGTSSRVTIPATSTSGNEGEPSDESSADGAAPRVEVEGVPLDRDLIERIAEAADALELDEAEREVVREVLAALNPLVNDNETAAEEREERVAAAAASGDSAPSLREAIQAVREERQSANDGEDEDASEKAGDEDAATPEPAESGNPGDDFGGDFRDVINDNDVLSAQEQ